MSQEVQGMLIQIEATTAQLRREMASADSVVGASTRKIDSQLAKVDGAFDRLNKQSMAALSDIKGNFDLLSVSVRAATAAIGAIGVGASLSRFIANTKAAEQEQAQLNAVLRSTGEAAGYSGAQLNAMAEKVASATTFSAGAVTTAQTSLLAFTGVVGTEFTRALDSAANMSARTGMSLTQTAELIGRALDVPSQGMASLSRQGFRFSEDQKALMKQLEATGKTAEAQGIILKALEESYGGAAAAARNTMVGALQALTNTFDDLLTGSETSLAGVVTAINAINSALASPEAAVAISALGDVLLAVSAIMAGRVVASATSAAGAFLVAQVQAVRYQAALASMAGVSRTSAIAITATATAARLASGAMALLGGPVGIVAATAASFLLFRDSSGEARQGLVDLEQPLDTAIEKFKALNEGQQRAELSGISKDIAVAVRDEAAAYDELLVAVRQDLGSSLGARIQKEFDDAREAGTPLIQVIDDVAGRLNLSPEVIQKWVDQNGKVENASVVTSELRSRMDALTDSTRQNTVETEANNAAKGGMSEAGNKYLATLQKQLAGLQDNGDAIKAANRYIAENTALTDADKAAILSAANAIEASKKANQARTAATKDSTKALKDNNAAIDSAIAKALPERKRLEDLVTSIKNLQAAHAKGKITALELGQGIKTLNEEYASPAVKKREEAEKKIADQIKKVDDAVQGVLDRLNPAAAATRKYTEEQNALNEAMKNHPERADEYRAALAKLGAEYEENQRSANQWAQFTQGAVDRVDEAFADAWRNVFDNTDSLLSGLKKGFQQTLAELAHMALTKPIIISFANQVLGTNTAGGISDVWGGLLGGGSGGTSGGAGLGGALQQANQVRSLYSTYGTIQSLLPALQGGWASGGFGGAFGAGASTLGGMFGLGSGAAGSMAAGSTAAGYGGANFAAWSAAQGGASAAGGAGVGAGMLSSMASAWPLAVAMGIWQSGKLYDQGVRPDAGEMWGSTQGNALGKIGNVAPTAMSGFYKGLDSVLEPVVGGKVAAMITGSTFHQALWGGINKALFGGAWQTKDFGLGLGIEDGGLDAQQFEYRKKKGGLFSSSKKKTIWSDLDSEVQSALDDTYAATADGVFSLFESLSYTIEDNALAGLNMAREQISTQGKTEEEIQTAIAEWFGKAANSMTAELNTVFGTGLSLDFAGMQAFVGNLQGVNEVIRYLNVDMFDMTVAGGKLAEQLSGIAGGLDALAGGVSTYYGAFFTESERMDDTLDAVARAFKDADVSLALNREAYRSMVEDIDLTTEAGQQLFATLMALSGQAASYYDILESRAATALQIAEAAVIAAQQNLMSAAGNSYGMVQRSIQAERNKLTKEYQAAVAQQQAAAQAQANAATARASSLNDMASTSQSVVQGLQSLDRSLGTALDKLLGTSADAVAMRREQSLELLRGALTLGQSGKSLTGFEGLENALGVAADLDQAVYGSLSEFRHEQGRTANLVAELQKVNGKQLTAEEKLLAQLQASARAAQASASAISSGISGVSAQLQAEYDAAIAALDEELANAQMQIDALNGIDNSILSVGVAVDRMNAAIVAAINGQQSAATGTDVSGSAATIDRLYRSILGYGADTEGQKFWQGALASGSYSYTDLVSGLRAQAGLDAGAKVPAFATGGAFANSVVRRPTYFNMAEMGEAGAEGILPLANVGGKLGVHAVLDAPVLDLDMPSRSASEPAGDSMAGVIAELRSLRGEVQHLRQYAYQDTKNSGDTVSGIRELIATTKRKGVPA